MISPYLFFTTTTTLIVLIVRLSVEGNSCIDCTKGCSDIACTKCKEGCYGVRCNTPCSNCGVGVSFNNSCDKTSGRCYECHVKFYGEKCNIKCPDLCAEGEACNRTTGICLQCNDTIDENECKTLQPNKTLNRNGSKMTSTSCKSNQTHSGTNEKTNSTCETKDMQENGSGEIIIYTVPPIVGLLVLLTTICVICRRNRKSQEKKPSLRRAEENVGLVDPPSKRRDVERGPNSTYNLRGSVALLTEIDHDAPPEPLPEPQPVSTDYFNVRFFKIPVKGLEEKVISMKENDEIFAEFADIPTGLLEMYDESTRKQIMKRNRYKGIYPYNHSRVPLEAEEYDGVKYPAYINACFVHGFKKENAYIAAQGPFTPDTIIDFWRMIWQHQCSQIVMLTNLVEGAAMKCLKYWPDEDDEYGPLEVIRTDENEFDSNTVRTFKMIKDGEEKTVVQFHFTDWPDKGVPEDETSILEFRQKVADNGNYETDGPMVVHCSAGIGRTGTFMALDYLLREGASMGYIDVINCVSKMRQQRVCVIQTPEQYTFLYDALVAGLRDVEVTNKVTIERQQQSVRRPSKPKGLMPLPSNEDQTTSNETQTTVSNEVVEDPEMKGPIENGGEQIHCLRDGSELDSVLVKGETDYRAENSVTGHEADTRL